MVLQVGRGSYVPDAHSCPGLRLEAFRFKESIAENIQSADVVISHAGKKLQNNINAEDKCVFVNTYSYFNSLGFVFKKFVPP